MENPEEMAQDFENLLFKSMLRTFINVCESYRGDNCEASILASSAKLFCTILLSLYLNSPIIPDREEFKEGINNLISLEFDEVLKNGLEKMKEFKKLN